MRRKNCCTVTVLVIGILLICIGLIIQFVVLPQVFNSNLEIKAGSLQYRNWHDPTIPIYMQWYVFNLTNVENFTTKQEKPHFVQLGPYTYREHRVKTDITWHSNGSVTYKNLRWWNFIPKKSEGFSEDDIIYSVNLPLLTVAESLQYESVLIKEIFQLLADSYNETLIKRYKMHELVWGYHDPMMTTAMNMMPDWFYTDFVGIFAGKNYTDDGVWTVSTGSKNISTVGQTEAYNGSLSLDFWSTQYANMVNGTDGTIASPHLNKVTNKRMDFFIPDICRSLYGQYTSEEKTSEGITLWRYSSTRKELLGPEKNPDNAGFCTPLGNCLGDGMMNLSNCQLLDHFKIPVVASLPHFLFADKQYIDKVEGLHPVESEHRTDVCVEPITGMVMRLAKRLQINMYVRQVDYLPVLADVDEMVFPIVWLNESAQVDGTNQDLYLSMMQLMAVATDMSYLLYALGGLMIVIAAVLFTRLCLKA
ncbi:lysosome membrane protein 2-like isoform X2 [Watersipora subatra]|uniref:lysosome membrane protein 2-like isoform X2 n=1 Tax=Watersipora subatra TaxID=2589382 RepID=UPI00355BF7EC